MSLAMFFREKIRRAIKSNRQRRAHAASYVAKAHPEEADQLTRKVRATQAASLRRLNGRPWNSYSVLR